MATNLAALFGTIGRQIPRAGNDDAPKLTRAQLAALGASAAPVLPPVGAAPVALQASPAAMPAALNPAGTTAMLPKVGTMPAAQAPMLTRPEVSSLAGNAPPVLPPLARVTNPLEDQVERQQALVNQDLTPRKSFHDLSGWGKVGRVLGTVGDVAGTMVAPAAMAMTPGTALHHGFQTRGDMRRLAELSQLDNKAQEEGRANEEMGIRTAAMPRRGAAESKSPWVVQPGDFLQHGQPVDLERNTATGEYRVAALPEGVNRREAQPKEATDAFDIWMRDPQDYEKFMSVMAKIKGSGQGKKGAYGDFGPAFLAYRLMDMGYNDNPALLPQLAPMIAKMLAQPGETTEQTRALEHVVGTVPSGQPQNAGGAAIGLRMPESPTGATRSRGQFAQSVLPSIDQVPGQIAALGADNVGPIAGRWLDLYQGKGGFEAPQYAALRSSLHNIATAWMRLHGNSEKTMRDFEHTLRTAQTPDDLVAGLNSIETQAEDYVKEGAGRPGELGKGAGAAGKPDFLYLPGKGLVKP